ncbi:hypothetical protein R3W88_029532 [Solanum pinnatisectum]|uniref:Uncharacterized protein n=1 Tax=Solanum pinnatisectum TaxID=50273 RepID=A0AAV9K5T4_9SOLN|nr:hypothetical protein R3W88_029532 [Solanum pinnatisectum]
MARVVHSIFYQCVNFEWGHSKVTIHRELSHPIHFVNSVPIKEELDATTFHTLVTSEMLKYAYKPKTGLGPMYNSIVEPIQLKHQRGTNLLKYEPTLREVHNRSSKVMILPTQTTIPN